ncbi:MAG: prepilin-type N-terminal cleavage/methylation domain-containing protein, partial [Terrimicrobiaceae bacterium]
MTIFRFRTSMGFSLVELLVVISLIVLLASLAGLSLRGGGAQLSTAGAHIATLMEQARETAILKRQPTALIMLADGGDVASRVFAVLGYVPDATGAGTWERLSRWEKLSEGVLADEGSDSGGNPLHALMPANSPVVAPALPTLHYAGGSFAPQSKYGYVVFMPDGSLYQDASGVPNSPFV